MGLGNVSVTSLIVVQCLVRV